MNKDQKFDYWLMKIAALAYIVIGGMLYPINEIRGTICVCFGVLFLLLSMFYKQISGGNDK